MRASLGDVHMRRRMIEGIDPHLESFLADQRRHSRPIISKALGSINTSKPASDAPPGIELRTPAELRGLPMAFPTHYSHDS